MPENDEKTGGLRQFKPPFIMGKINVFFDKDYKM